MLRCLRLNVQGTLCSTTSVHYTDVPYGHVAASLQHCAAVVPLSLHCCQDRIKGHCELQRTRQFKRGACLGGERRTSPTGFVLIAWTPSLCQRTVRRTAWGHGVPVFESLPQAVITGLFEIEGLGKGHVWEIKHLLLAVTDTIETTYPKL